MKVKFLIDVMIEQKPLRTLRSKHENKDLVTSEVLYLHLTCHHQDLDMHKMEM
jgi:hypothetical protein